jgi:uncharacterized membrane-anchored protein YitT (DUF2179 family)
MTIDLPTLLIIVLSFAFCLALAWALYLILIALAGMIWDTVQQRIAQRQVALIVEQAELKHRQQQANAVREAERICTAQGERQEGDV